MDLEKIATANVMSSSSVTNVLFPFINNVGRNLYGMEMYIFILSGIFYIGKNDNGDVVGLSDKDRKKLLEYISNKITNIMGIVADANLLYENDLLLRKSWI